MKEDKLKIIFAGTPDFAIPSLEALIKDSEIEVVAVFTQPDKPFGRNQEITPPPVKLVANINNIPVYQPEELSLDYLKELQPDMLVVVAYGMILPKDVLDFPKFGCINLHASLLPKYRGASPIQSAILGGDEETGITFMRISEKLDSGDIYAKYKIKIGKKNAEEVGKALAHLGGEKFPDVLKMIAGGEAKPIPQEESEATFCEKIKREDGKADWEKDTTEMLGRKLRAYYPWPGVFTVYQGKILKLLDYEAVEEKINKPAGEVFEYGGKVSIATLDGRLILEKVQLEGKQALKIDEFLKGDRKLLGSWLG